MINPLKYFYDVGASDYIEMVSDKVEELRKELEIQSSSLIDNKTSRKYILDCIVEVKTAIATLQEILCVKTKERLSAERRVLCKYRKAGYYEEKNHLLIRGNNDIQRSVKRQYHDSESR